MRGSCLCETVEYEVSRLDSPIQHCSCRTCRKAHAAAFNTAAEVLRDNFRWSKGDDSLKSYESSPGKFRYFCGKCGTQLVAQREESEFVILRVATLDDDPKQEPAHQIWASHSVPWLKYGPEITAYPEWAPEAS